MTKLQTKLMTELQLCSLYGGPNENVALFVHKATIIKIVLKKASKVVKYHSVHMLSRTVPVVLQFRVCMYCALYSFFVLLLLYTENRYRTFILYSVSTIRIQGKNYIVAFFRFSTSCIDSMTPPVIYMGSFRCNSTSKWRV